MAISDHDFLRMIEEEFPNEDWDAVPDPETLPDIYKVQGQWLQPAAGKRKECVESFEVQNEYVTREQAEAQLERCKTWEGVLPESLKIVTLKPWAALSRALYRDWRREILEGKKVFPLNLP